MRASTLLVLAGCGVQIGGEEEGDACGRVHDEEVALTDVVAGGRSIADEIGSLQGPRTYAAAWADGHEEGLTVSWSPAEDTATVHVQELPECASDYELSAEVHLVSDDGTIDERWTQTVRGTLGLGFVGVSFETPVDAMGGTLDWAPLEPDATSLVGVARLHAEPSYDTGSVELEALTPYRSAASTVSDEPASSLRRTLVCAWGD